MDAINISKITFITGPAKVLMLGMVGAVKNLLEPEMTYGRIRAYPTKIFVKL